MSSMQVIEGDERVLSLLNKLEFHPNYTQINKIIEKYGMGEVGKQGVTSYTLKEFCTSLINREYDTFEQMHYSWLYGETITFIYNFSDKKLIEDEIMSLNEEKLYW